MVQPGPGGEILEGWRTYFFLKPDLDEAYRQLIIIRGVSTLWIIPWKTWLES